jgi:hypothetical protein
MGDLFSRLEANLKRVQEVGASNPQLFEGDSVRVRLPCDDVSSWQGDVSCLKCPRPCVDDSEADERKEK